MKRLTPEQARDLKRCMVIAFAYDPLTKEGERLARISASLRPVASYRCYKAIANSLASSDD